MCTRCPMALRGAQVRGGVGRAGGWQMWGRVEQTFRCGSLLQPCFQPSKLVLVPHAVYPHPINHPGKQATHPMTSSTSPTSL